MSTARQALDLTQAALLRRLPSQSHGVLTTSSLGVQRFVFHCCGYLSFKLRESLSSLNPKCRNLLRRIVPFSLPWLLEGLEPQTWTVCLLLVSPKEARAVGEDSECGKRERGMWGVQSGVWDLEFPWEVKVKLSIGIKGKMREEERHHKQWK